MVSPNALIVVLIILFLAFGLITFGILANYGALWLQAFMTKTPITMLEIIGMKFRKVNPRIVIQSMIMANQAGIALSRAELERAYLQGVDLVKITLAAIQAKKKNLDLTFQQLVDADLEGKLEEKLKQS
jgi:uncharacterized protein YqfA (UPF0365 family)